jgi:hypothetical protein
MLDDDWQLINIAIHRQTALCSCGPHGCNDVALFVLVVPTVAVMCALFVLVGRTVVAIFVLVGHTVVMMCALIVLAGHTVVMMLHSLFLWATPLS